MLPSTDHSAQLTKMKREFITVQILKSQQISFISFMFQHASHCKTNYIFYISQIFYWLAINIDIREFCLILFDWLLIAELLEISNKHLMRKHVMLNDVTLCRICSHSTTRWQQSALKNARLCKNLLVQSWLFCYMSDKLFSESFSESCGNFFILL